jgi:hypothetical protein
MATLLKVLINLADIKSAGDVALRVRTQARLRQDRLRHPGAEHRQRRRTCRLVSGPDGRGGDRGRRRPAAAHTDLVLPGGVGPGHNRTVQLRSRFSNFRARSPIGPRGGSGGPRSLSEKLRILVRANRILLVHEQYAVRLTTSRNAPSKLTRIRPTQHQSLTRSVVEMFKLFSSRYCELN